MSKALRTVALFLALASPALAEGSDDAFNPNARPLKIDKAPRPAVATPPRTVGHEAPPIAPQDQQVPQDQQDAQGWPPAAPPDSVSARPSNSATTGRPSTRPNMLGSALHSASASGHSSNRLKSFW
jgi:hypothetical protein